MKLSFVQPSLNSERLTAQICTLKSVILEDLEDHFCL